MIRALDMINVGVLKTYSVSFALITANGLLILSAEPSVSTEGNNLTMQEV